MANPNVNRINATISAPDLTAITNALTALLTALLPYTQPLTEEERKSLFSLAEENLVFSQEALAQGQLLNAGFPAQMQTIVTNMNTDVTLWGQFNSINIGNLAQAVQRVNDSQRLSAHEIFTAALAIYKFIEAGAALGLVGYAASYEILKARFAAQGGNPPVPGP